MKTATRERTTQPAISPTAEGPAMLPAHLVAVGEHYRLSDSSYWIGCARAAYEEAQHLHGMVIYDRNRWIFLTPPEMAQMHVLLAAFLHQEEKRA